MPLIVPLPSARNARESNIVPMRPSVPSTISPPSVVAVRPVNVPVIASPLVTPPPEGTSAAQCAVPSVEQPQVQLVS